MSMLYVRQPLVVNPALAVRIGLNESIILQQLHYWLTSTNAGVEHGGRRWIFNTQQQWQEQFPFWSVDTIKRAFKSLVDAGLILVEQLNKSKHDRTNFYTICYDHESLIEHGNLHRIEQSKMPSSTMADCTSLTETTTETTTEKKSTVTAGRRPDDCPYQEIADLYNEVTKGVLKGCLELNDKRKRNIRKCWDMKIKGKQPFKSLEFWRMYFNDCTKNPHWCGENQRGWKADIEFVTRTDSVLTVLEA